MSGTQRLWAVALGSALAGAIVAGAVVWFAQAEQIETLETELARATSEAESPTAQARVDELERQLAEVTARYEAAVSGEPPAAEEEDVAADDPGAAESPTDDGRYFCFITAVRRDGDSTLLTADFAQLLTGAKAAAAAAAAGDESPPPNDYYIVNDNPRLRTFPVDVTMNVRMTSSSEGTRPEGYVVPFMRWYEQFSDTSDDAPPIRGLPYWITIDDGTVVQIEEQYTP